MNNVNSVNAPVVTYGLDEVGEVEDGHEHEPADGHGARRKRRQQRDHSVSWVAVRKAGQILKHDED